MKTSLFLTSLLILFAAARCRQETPLETPLEPTQLYGTWMHSFEEDTDIYKVYRLTGYEFPPARGREGFTIAANGEFVLLAIAAADGTESRPGQWVIRDNNTIDATLQETGQHYLIKVLGIDDEVMRVAQEQ